jgi:FkbM family methyltransferase
MRSLRRRYFEARYGGQDFVTTYRGARFKVNLRNDVLRNIALRSFEQAHISRMLDVCERLQPDLFVDIGAHCGVYSNILLSRNKSLRGIAFEPDERTFNFLRENASLNNLSDRIDLYPAAVGAKRDVVYFIAAPDSNTGWSYVSSLRQSERDRAVEVLALDDMLSVSGKKLVMKIDVENYELEALRGMSRLLECNSGVVQIECTTNRAEVVEFMKKKQFRLVDRLYYDHIFEKA